MTDSTEPVVELTEQEEHLIGAYSDIVVKQDVAAADEFLETLPEKPSARVQDLLQTARGSCILLAV